MPSASRLAFALGFACAASAVAAADAPTAAPANTAKPTKKPEKNEWVFSILPKSLQKNPRLEMTVITEMTDAGKKLPPVSPDKPAYFETFSSGFHQLGSAPANEKTLTAVDIERILVRALAANGYLPAKPPLRPSLVILYTWGSHNRLDDVDQEDSALGAQQIARNILDRAALVGGEKFAKKMLEMFLEADAQNTAASVPVPPGGEAVITQEQLDFTNPINQFRRADPKNDFLVDQTANDLYYVVASAYDYQSMAQNKRILLWRTRMTVAAQGVSQEQTLPTLVASAAPYFGKDMPDPETLSRRVLREGNVEIGTPTVVESDVGSPAKR
jgi:hypothetical protein